MAVKFLYEGKTKIVYEIPGREDHVVLKFKNDVSAGDGAASWEIEGKSSFCNTVNGNSFRLLNYAGIHTAFIETHAHDDTVCVVRRCDMVPIEWVVRRRVWGKFTERHPGYKKGDFCFPPYVEIEFKDDSNHDPHWTEKQLVEAKLKIGPTVIGRDEVAIMKKTTVAAFEILERAWAAMNCSLIDIKVEFGITSAGEILLADVIDNDSFRLWEDGDPKKMRDGVLFRACYNNNEEVTPQILATVKENFTWAANKSKGLMRECQSRVVVMMDSVSDVAHCERILQECRDLGVHCELRTSSARIDMDDTMEILGEYTGDHIPTMFIVVSGNGNSLGQIITGNVCSPVIECLPMSADRGAEGVCPQRLSSGLGHAISISPKAAALQAARILGLTDHMIWARLRSRQLKSWTSIKFADMKIRNDSKELRDLIQ